MQVSSEKSALQESIDSGMERALQNAPIITYYFSSPLRARGILSLHVGRSNNWLEIGRLKKCRLMKASCKMGFFSGRSGFKENHCFSNWW